MQEGLLQEAAAAAHRSLRGSIIDLPDPLNGQPSNEVACVSEMGSVGMLPMEDATLLIRVLCTIVAASIISSWVEKRKTQRLLLFYVHWCSGLIYLLMEWLMASMIFACWSSHKSSTFIKFLKFVELTADNMVVLTNLAICRNLAAIVASSNTIARVKSTASARTVWTFIGLSILISLTSAAFWGGDLITTGTQYWVENAATGSSSVWVTVSQFMLELGGAVVMLIALAYLLVFRLPELRQCWAAHMRIKFYFCLSCTAIATNLAVGIGGVLWVAWKRDPRFIVVGWSMRHVHIALDTLVLYGVLVKPMDTLDQSRLGGDTDETKNGSPATQKEHSNGEGRVPVITL